MLQVGIWDNKPAAVQALDSGIEIQLLRWTFKGERGRAVPGIFRQIENVFCWQWNVEINNAEFPLLEEFLNRRVRKHASRESADSIAKIVSWRCWQPRGAIRRWKEKADYADV